MSEPPLIDPIRRHQQDQQRGVRDRKRGLGATLTLVGTLGWLIVLPPLGGLFLGRWLDDINNSNQFWTLSLLFTGVGLGCWMAWRRVTEEDHHE